MKAPKTIRMQGFIYKKAAPMGAAPGSPMTPSRGQGGGNFGRQKALQPAVQKVLPKNPDPLFDKAAKLIDRLEKMVDGTTDIDHKDLDFKLLCKRYNLPSLRLLLSEWADFSARLKKRTASVKKEIRAARGQSEEF